MATRVVNLKDTTDIKAIIAEASSIVRLGGLVAFPTETVYGIACLVRPDALARLDQVKQRPPDKPYSLHIGCKDRLLQIVPHLPLKARKLADRTWPGPLTIVVQLDKEDLAKGRSIWGQKVYDLSCRDGCIGIRCPDHPVAAALLEGVCGPVVGPSANPAGMPPPVDANMVLRYLDGKIDLVLDAGPCPHGQSSTVARIDSKGVEVLREGAYTKDQLEALSEVRLLFVCTGNTCRSAMAQGLCRRYLADRLGCQVDDLQRMGYSVHSAGMMDVGGMPASVGARAACAVLGVDISGHKSRVLTAELIRDSDLIFGMEQAHIDAVVDMEPQAASRTMLLDEQGPIEDPIGRPDQVYQRSAQRIWTAIDKRIRELVL